MFHSNRKNFSSVGFIFLWSTEEVLFFKALLVFLSLPYQQFNGLKRKINEYNWFQLTLASVLDVTFSSCFFRRSLPSLNRLLTFKINQISALFFHCHAQLVICGWQQLQNWQPFIIDPHLRPELTLRWSWICVSMCAGSSDLGTVALHPTSRKLQDTGTLPQSTSTWFCSSEGRSIMPHHWQLSVSAGKFCNWTG